MIMKKVVRSKKIVKKKSKEYQIYGIFDFQEKILLSVNLDQEQIGLEFDISDYDVSRYSIIMIPITII